MNVVGKGRGLALVCVCAYEQACECWIFPLPQVLIVVNWTIPISLAGVTYLTCLGKLGVCRGGSTLVEERLTRLILAQVSSNTKSIAGSM
jgi:hypothetical protein